MSSSQDARQLCASSCPPSCCVFDAEPERQTEISYCGRKAKSSGGGKLPEAGEEKGLLKKRGNRTIPQNNCIQIVSRASTCSLISVEMLSGHGPTLCAALLGSH